MLGGGRAKYVTLGLSVLAPIVVLVGVFAYAYAVGSMSGFKEAETKHYKTEYAEDTANRITSCQRYATPALLAECIEKALRANHENQRNESDLKAQSHMADWTFWALVIASCSLGVTGIGTTLLLWQIMLTREAVVDTGKATKAMERQNDMMAEADRPWLLPDRVDIGRIEQGGIYFRIRLKNFGVRPAAKVFVWSKIEVCDSADELPKFPRPKVEDHHGFAGPNSGVFTTPQTVSTGQVNAWRERRCFLWLCAVAYYSEPGVEGRPYGTKVFYRLEYAGMRIGEDDHPIPIFHAINGEVENHFF